MKILVINAGSSSLKYQLIDMETETVLAKGLCERIGIDGHIKHSPLVGGKPVFESDLAMPTHSEAISAVIEKLTSAEYGVVASMDEIDAVGHRVVHGGEAFAGSVRIDADVMKALEDCIPLAPLHNPANITGINACTTVMGPDVPQVGVFDTAFHQTMPKKAFTYAIPYQYYTDYRVRRYGFHGTSHRYVSGRAAEMLGKPIEALKLISCHMGNGSSICAIDGGKSVDTSMGFTPIAGVPMGTRCGDIDVSCLEYIMGLEHIDIKAMTNILNKKSGVLGVSGVSSDFRDLEEAADKGNDRAALALNMFYYSVAKTVGAYVAAMNGVDAIIFTAGIGENSATTRAAIADYLKYLGCEIDPELNKKRGQDLVISTPESRVKLMVIPTNEELVIARDTRDIVFGK
jgi:acetate kinase